MKAIIKLALLVSVFSITITSCFSDENTSTSTPSNWKTCPTHGTTYTDGNAYGGCPDCFKDKMNKNSEKAREKASHL